MEPYFGFPSASLVETIQPRDAHDYYDNYHGPASSGSFGPKTQHQYDPHFRIPLCGEHWKVAAERAQLREEEKAAKEREAREREKAIAEGRPWPPEEGAGATTAAGGAGAGAGAGPDGASSTTATAAATGGEKSKKKKSSSAAGAGGAGAAAGTDAKSAAAAGSKKASSSSSKAGSGAAGALSASTNSKSSLALATSLSTMGLEDARLRRTVLDTDKALGGDKSFHQPNAQSLSQRLLSLLVEQPPGTPRAGPWSAPPAAGGVGAGPGGAAGSGTGSKSKSSGAAGVASVAASGATGKKKAADYPIDKRIEMELRSLGLLQGAPDYSVSDSAHATVILLRGTGRGFASFRG